MLVDLVLYNAKIYTLKGIMDGGIAIEERRIFKIAKEPNLPKACEKLDLKGLLLIPGLIDAHVHLRDQQLAYKEDFTSGTAAAAAGGITLVIDMPNNKPVTMSPELLRERIKTAERRVFVNVAFYAAFPEERDKMRLMVDDGGAVAFKFFLSKKVGGVDPEDDDAITSAFSEAGRIGVPVVVHAEDKRTLEETRKVVQLSGRRDVEAYVMVHSPEAEVKAVQRILRLVKEPNAHIHFCHVSSPAGLNAILAAKRAGLSVTCEATPHHLLLSTKALEKYGTMALTDPPLRDEEDREFLWGAFSKGLIDIVASDHAPHTIDEKMVDNVWDVSPGVPGLETMLPLLLTQVNRGLLTMGDVVRLAAENSARIFNLKGRGHLAEGYFADLVGVDLRREYRIDSSRFKSKAKYSPFDGWMVKGKPVKTFVNGELIMDEGEIVSGPGAGQIVRWVD